jgi:hypothetical protein
MKIGLFGVDEGPRTLVRILQGPEIAQGLAIQKCPRVCILGKIEITTVRSQIKISTSE